MSFTLDLRLLLLPLRGEWRAAAAGAAHRGEPGRV